MWHGPVTAAVLGRARLRRRRRSLRRGALGVFVVLLGYGAVTMYPCLTQPGTDGVAARVAEWGRDHRLGWAVTWLENASSRAPVVGGELSAGQRARLAGPHGVLPGGSVGAPDLPADIAPAAAGPLPGEGVWDPLAAGPGGAPILEWAALRPDAQHTSQLAYAVWMEQKALKFSLDPGYRQPGGTWRNPDMIAAGRRAGLVATWNGGFKIKPDDALGGFWAAGRSAAALVGGEGRGGLLAPTGRCASAPGAATRR